MTSRKSSQLAHTEPVGVQEYDDAVPNPGAMIESLRAFGYSTQAAIADLIDNSVTAQARNVWVTFHWRGVDSYVRVRDDGRGMSEDELRAAMRLGSSSPLDRRDDRDLGRFGLGLKTASFSQCRRLTVASRRAGDQVSIRRWDLDYVGQTAAWRLLKGSEQGSEERLDDLASAKSGTVVLWEILDRLVGDAAIDDEKAHRRFLEAVALVRDHLAMTFHRFLEKDLSISFGDNTIEPRNPFLPDGQATQVLQDDKLYLGKKAIIVRPYVLPHHSKIERDVHERAAGRQGWNALQGFYVYRNERLLVPGTWLGLGFQQEEHYRLARIQLDFDNSMDTDWRIDVRKSLAIPPGPLREDLKRIAKVSRRTASDVYRQRGKILDRKRDGDHVPAWNRRLRHGKIWYGINREHPLVAEALRIPKPYRRTINAALRLVEETVPTPSITIDHAEQPQSQAGPFEGVQSREVLAVLAEVYRTLRKRGLSRAQVQERIVNMEPFDRYPELVAALDDSIG